MTVEERNTILEAVDILRTLGGNNGFSNLQPKLKRMLLQKANALNDVVVRDIHKYENFTGETIVGGSANDS